MPHTILDRLQADHQELSRFLYSFRVYMQRLEDPSSQGDISLILNMLDFINIYPEHFHHPIEDLLFQHLLDTYDKGDMDVAKTLQQHAVLESFTQNIRTDFVTLSQGSQHSLDRFLDQVMNYIDMQIAHLIEEEIHIFPLIEELFDDNDWRMMETAIESQFPGDHWEEFQWETEAMLAEIEKLVVSGDYTDLSVPGDIQRDVE